MTKIIIRLLGISSIAFSFILFNKILKDLSYYPHAMNSIYVIHRIITAPCWFVCGMGILKFWNWARIGLIMLSVVCIMETFEFLGQLYEMIANAETTVLPLIAAASLLFIFNIVYLTRKKVVNVFKERVTLDEVEKS
jgi:hypothetical protein